MSDNPVDNNKDDKFWSYEETRAFISLMIDENVTQLMDGKKMRTAQIFNLIKQKMYNLKYSKTVAQLIAKYRRLKAKYNNCKQQNNKSGNSRKNFEFYDEMSELLYGRPNESFPKEFGKDSSDDIVFEGLF